MSVPLSAYPTLNIRYSELLKRLAKHLDVTVFAVSLHSETTELGRIRTVKVPPLGRPKRVITPLGGYIGSIVASALKPDVFWVIDCSFPEKAYSFMRGAPLIVGIDDPISLPKSYLLSESYRRIRRERLLLGNSRVRRIVVPTQMIKDGLSKALKIDKGKITVIPNGVDTNLFRPTPLPKNNTILYYGSFSHHRCKLLLRVIQHVYYSKPIINIIWLPINLLGEGWKCVISVDIIA